VIAVRHRLYVPASLHIMGNICDSWFTPKGTTVNQRLSVAAVSLLTCLKRGFAADGVLLWYFWKDAMEHRGLLLTPQAY